jgi:hypothetical protein
MNKTWCYLTELVEPCGALPRKCLFHSFIRWKWVGLIERLWYAGNGHPSPQREALNGQMICANSMAITGHGKSIPDKNAPQQFLSIQK